MDNAPPQNPQVPQVDMPTLLEQMRQELVNLRGQVQQQGNALQAAQAQALPPVGPAPAPRIKPDRPPPFTGKKSESLEAWIFQMTQFCEIAPVPALDRIQFAATFFKDQAALWWRSYYQDQDWEGAPPHWNEFVAALKQQFIPVNTSISAYDRLQRLTQKTSVNLYNHEFRAIMLDLPDMDQATRMNYYLRGLKENIRPYVAMQQPENIATAEAIAERVDAVTYKAPTRNTGFKFNPNYRAPGGPTPMELDSITKLTPAERERLRKMGGCFRCRKPGHLARDCPLPNRQHPRVNAMNLDEAEQPDESGKE